MIVNELVGQRSYTETCGGGGGKSCPAVCFEATFRLNDNKFVTIHELPGIRPKKRLM